jgi:hypothetical protein
MEGSMSRMKVLTVVIFCTILGASIGLAQGLYLTANAGYSLGAGTQTLGTNYSSIVTPASNEGVYGSFGEGFKFGASAGYMFSKNLGAELGLWYWLGNTFEMQNKQTTFSMTSKLSGSGFVAIPSIVLSANMETINPYARLGLVFGILKRDSETKYQSASQTVEYAEEETGNLAFGYAGALGFLVPAGSTVGFFIEADIHSVTYSPDQIKYTKYTVDGVDRLSSVDPKVYKYKESYPSGQGTVWMAVRRPFSSVGMVVGVRINL